MRTKKKEVKETVDEVEQEESDADGEEEECETSDIEDDSSDEEDAIERELVTKDPEEDDEEQATKDTNNSNNTARSVKRTGINSNMLITNTTRNKRFPSASVNLFANRNSDPLLAKREPAEPQLPLLTKPLLHPNEAFPEFPDFDTLDSLLKQISVNNNNNTQTQQQQQSLPQPQPKQ
eukprot:TRINITY_DN3015_c0_g1_i1.p2 TRINITY_DN3015_c0_g1~~TRINITY_DN3015_c0_g1_i1.p2  ORF type:complete len:178 (+),score=71.85 TRINITY_DN3015_c0_g1_i1:115-648(+)